MTTKQKNATINNLPVLEYLNLKDHIDPRNALLISSPSALKVSANYLRKLNVSTTIIIDSANKEYVEKIALTPVKAEICYAIGGGRVVDVARYLASRWELEVICIPTIISTDAFLVDCTGLRENYGVTYIPSKRAEKVLVDYNLIREANLEYNLSGCGDVLSIYTALYDWERSRDNYLPGVAAVARGILTGLICEAEEIKKGSIRGLNILLTQLSMEVQLCYFYGNSRPEEGGEHFFVYCLENKFEPTLHGEMVCFGILLTAFIQGQSVDYIKKFMDNVGINYRPRGLTKSIVLETLREVSDYVKKHKLPKSVYNDFMFKTQEVDLNKFISTIL